MDSGFQALLLDGEYPFSPTYAYVAKAEPYHFEFRQLPELRLMENIHQYGGVTAAKRRKKSPETENKAKQRRQSVSEKYRCLEKLLPCHRKMDTGTMLEEANKYIRFLQAQVSVLQHMPLMDPTAQSSTETDVYGAGLGRLSRQQLLEVVLNSHVAQDVLYTRGCCVYSTEQLALVSQFLSHCHF